MPRQIFDALLQESKSQLRQDFIALSELDFKMNGYFVEFEATNGIDLSNTYLLEKCFGWTCILAARDREKAIRIAESRSHCHLSISI